jgi:hypothetical protein
MSIEFKPLDFKSLPEDFRFKIRNSNAMTLISVKPSGMARYSRTRSGKDAIVSEHAEGDLLMLAWTGRHGTDIFLVTRADIDRHYE